MTHHLKHYLGILAAVALGACAPAISSSSASPVSGGAQVIESERLGERGTLSVALDERVLTVHVDPTDTCPTVSMRGQSSSLAAKNPKVYVDGVAAMNTCVLDAIRTVDVERVELYPTGHVSRPGYVPNAHGVIAVFTRT